MFHLTATNLFVSLNFYNLFVSLNCKQKGKLMKSSKFYNKYCLNCSRSELEDDDELNYLCVSKKVLLFTRACRNGELDRKELAKHGDNVSIIKSHIDEKKINDEWFDEVFRSCLYGNDFAFQLILKKKTRLNEQEIDNAFCGACVGGHLVLADLIYNNLATHDYSRTEIVISALIECCDDGNDFSIPYLLSKNRDITKGLESIYYRSVEHMHCFSIIVNHGIIIDHLVEHVMDTYRICELLNFGAKECFFKKTEKCVTLVINYTNDIKKHVKCLLDDYLCVDIIVYTILPFVNFDYFKWWVNWLMATSV